ncbi:MAG: hypothetical protein O2822_06390, partial [Chloroflexi bacterium]|nr:hypothetical protein [Chloroflexota bacterium]
GAARMLGLGIGIAFMLAPLRLGWAGVVLSESLNDSLMAVLIALAVLLVTLPSRLAPGSRRTLTIRGLIAALAILGLGWVLARDTNAITVLVAVPVATATWAFRAGIDRRAVVATSAALLVTAGALWTAQVVPRQPTGLTLTRGWDASATPRARIPVFNNLFIRILPDAEARAWFAARGMPLSPPIIALQAPPGAAPWAWDRRALADPAFAPLRAWVGRDGTFTYLRWLAIRPLHRVDEIVRDAGGLLAPRDLDFYMPAGWARERVPVTTNAALILALLVAAPFASRHVRRSGAISVAWCLVISGSVSAVAAYYGDAIEISRHAYGAGQQVVVGLAIGAAGWVEAASAGTPGSRWARLILGRRPADEHADAARLVDATDDVPRAAHRSD